MCGIAGLCNFKGDIEIRKGKETDTFIPFGGGEVEHPEENEYVYRVKGFLAVYCGEHHREHAQKVNIRQGFHDDLTGEHQGAQHAENGNFPDAQPGFRLIPHGVRRKHRLRYRSCPHR